MQFWASTKKEDLNTRANERISYVSRVMKKEIRLRESTRWLTRQYLILLDEIMKAIYPMKSKERQGGRSMDFTALWWDGPRMRQDMLKESQKNNPTISTDG